MSCRASRILVALVFTLTGLLSAARQAAARPQYAAREGMYCASCHVNPAGGGQRNANGFNYARGRHASDVEAKFESWNPEPEVSKGVRVGTDLRYVGMTAGLSAHYDGQDDPQAGSLYSSYAMQGGLYLSFTPVEQLVIYYNHDIAAGAAKQRDFWGMVRGLTPLNIYVRAGQLRAPYGLRLDDHTAFVRGSANSPPGEVGMMDLDPRLTNPGVEAGFLKNGVFFHGAYQDPAGTFSPSFTKVREKMFSARAGWQKGHAMIGASGRSNGLGDADEETKSTRYGLFGSWGMKCVALLAEVDAGKDKSAGQEVNVQGAYLAAEYYLNRTWSLRAEGNYMDFDEGAGVSRVSRRFGVGAALDPLPFLRLSAEGRLVSNSNGGRNSFDQTWGLFYAVFSF